MLVGYDESFDEDEDAATPVSLPSLVPDDSNDSPVAVRNPEPIRFENMH